MSALEELTVSVIMPFAGEESFIGEAIDSIVHNTYCSELIVCVDTTQVDRNAAEAFLLTHKAHIESYSKKFTICFSQVPGPASARNEAIRHANSKLILPVDADDRISPDYCAKIVESFRNDKNDDLGIVYGPAEKFGLNSGTWNLPEFSLSQIVLENCIYATAGFRKSDWLKCGGYSESLIYGQEDWDFWLAILSLGRSVKYINGETVFFYRIRTGSRSALFSQMWEQVIWTYDEVCRRNEKLMASEIKSIYHKRIVLELENTTLSRASKNVLIAIVRKYTFFNFLDRTKVGTLLRKMWT